MSDGLDDIETLTLDELESLRVRLIFSVENLGAQMDQTLDQLYTVEEQIEYLEENDE